MIDFSEFTDRFSAGIDNIKETLAGNKKMAITVMAILIVMTISAVVILVIAAGNKTATTVATETERQFNATQTLVVPPSPVVTEGYIYSRDRHGKWTEKDAETWFTMPTQNTIDELAGANDRIANEITGAAP